MLTVSGAFKTTYPGAAMGILAMRQVANPAEQAALNREKQMLETEIRARFADRDAIKTHPTILVYNDYLKPFKKTYHVQLQLESIALKGKSIPRVSALVEAMFMAELKNMLLTAGHDLDALRPPITLNVATGAERYVLLNGQEQTCKPNDMLVADSLGVVSSIVYGPDFRTRITAESRDVLFCVYAPPGTEQVRLEQHLRAIQANVMLIAPGALTELLQIFDTGGNV
ncbi:MAG: hypothetical protein HY782_13855 [Chloroflexi bacterium]|nr:hypothetical protein [Chloroflexota bacterium]